MRHTLKLNQMAKKEEALESVTANKSNDVIVNCLVNKKIIIRHIDKGNTLGGNDKKHVISGGMANNATKSFCLPQNEDGTYYNVLTKDEQTYLENIMGLEHNMLSVHRSHDLGNFWDTRFVKLRKQDNYFDLKDPEQFINYKILLANKDFICPDIQSLKSYPKATYQFVIIDSTQELDDKISRIELNQKATMLYGSIMENYDKLAHVVATITGRNVSSESTIGFLKTKAYELMENNRRLFIDTIEDKFIDTKILVRKSLTKGIVIKRGDFFYLKDGNMPLCNNGEDPIIANVCKYLNQPKNQELKFNIEQAVR